MSSDILDTFGNINVFGQTVALGMSLDIWLPSDYLQTYGCLRFCLRAYDIAPRVSGTPELCGARICVLRLTMCPLSSARNMSQVDFVSPEFCEDCVSG
ncbi:hypothetical protein L3X38_026345 [Prunus dulcis]|uniref:Uncharacterized protein n=1 Tax=Prunus dulcis TaxID=3755 RepID=A0AAD4YZD6_PRUDU|nr:hypothetical protein L3X38_026345 [Prunus dulcis]